MCRDRARVGEDKYMSIKAIVDVLRLNVRLLKERKRTNESSFFHVGGKYCMFFCFFFRYTAFTFHVFVVFQFSGCILSANIYLICNVS